MHMCVHFLRPIEVKVVFDSIALTNQTMEPTLDHCQTSKDLHTPFSKVSVVSMLTEKQALANKHFWCSRKCCTRY